MRRRGSFQHGITLDQPSAIEQFEPRATVGTPGQIEVGRSRTYVGRLSGAALLEVGPQPLDVFPREQVPGSPSSYVRCRGRVARRGRRSGASTRAGSGAGSAAAAGTPGT